MNSATNHGQRVPVYKCFLCFSDFSEVQKDVELSYFSLFYLSRQSNKFKAVFFFSTTFPQNHIFTMLWCNSESVNQKRLCKKSMSRRDWVPISQPRNVHCHSLKMVGKLWFLLHFSSLTNNK